MIAISFHAYAKQFTLEKYLLMSVAQKDIKCKERIITLIRKDRNDLVQI